MFEQIGWHIAGDVRDTASHQLVVTDLDGTEASAPLEQDGTGGGSGYAPGGLTETDAVALTERLATTVRDWFATTKLTGRAFLNWRDCVNDTGGNRVRRRHSMIAFSMYDEDQDVTGKAGVFLTKGLDEADEQELYAAFERAVAQTERLAAGLPFQDRVRTLLLGPRAAATFVHELAGHLCEADNAAFPGAPRIGQRVTPADLTVDDGPQVAGEWGETTVDDEGRTTARTRLIDAGVVTGLLNDTRTAGDGSGNGHGLRWSHRHPVLPRITQIGAAPGDQTPASLLASVRDGLYVDNFGYGFLNPRTAQARFVVREAQTVVGGELTGRTVRGGEFRWSIDQALHAVRGIGSDVAWFPAQCMKRKQTLPVLQGSGSLLLEFPAGASGD